MADDTLDGLDSNTGNFNYYRYCRRYLDLLLIVLSLPLTAPFALVISCILFVYFRGNILFSQERVGFMGRVFKIYKFRTMKNCPESMVESYEMHLTKFGRFLRRHKFDELPQFINVIKGEMSLIGPRPEIPEQYDLFVEAIQDYRKRKKVLPGITGLAQITHPHSTSVEGNSRKLSADLEYAGGISLKTDLRIALRTLYCMIFGRIK